MRTRMLALLTILVVVAAACSSGDTAEQTTTMAGSAAPGTTPPSSSSSSTTTPLAPPAVEAVSAGIGDELYPDLGNPGYDVAHYTLDLAFEPQSRELVGVVTISATALTTLNSFNLDAERLSIDGVMVDDAPAAFAGLGEELTIVPVAAIAAGEDFVVEVAYRTTAGPVASRAIRSPIGWINSATEQHYVVAEPDGAHSWFPSNDHPIDKATYTFRITVPNDVTAAANGALVDTINGTGEATWVWEMEFDMATYLATVVIGAFEIVADDAGASTAGVPIRNVLPAGTTIEDWPGLERQGEMLAFLADLFGPYPFDRYGIAIVDGFGAALENQTLSLFDSAVASSALFEDVLIHELAHQWFGNSVSPGRWSDIWLNEGFASYAEWLWIEREQGRDTLELGIREERDFWAAQAEPQPPGAPLADDLFSGPVYRVGAMTLHALRLTVGDDGFFSILRTYAREFGGGNATTADFVAVAEEVSGEDLADLFDSWLYAASVPQFPPPA